MLPRPGLRRSANVDSSSASCPPAPECATLDEAAIPSDPRDHGGTGYLMNGIDVAILLAFAAWALASGLRARQSASRNLEEYFLAGRRLRGWQAGASMAATQFAADTPLLVMGLIATAGIFSLWRLWIYALSFLLLGFVLAPLWRRAAVLTDAELAELRYSGKPAAWLRTAKALYFGTLFNCVVLAMVLFAAKEIAEPFLHWNLWLPASIFDALQSAVKAVGVPYAASGAGWMSESASPDLWLRSTNNLISLALLVALTLCYSAIGGLRGVVRTDLMQLAIMLLATLGYAAWVVDANGGLATMHETLAERFGAGGPTGLRASELLAFTPGQARDASFAMLSVLGLQWLVQMNADGTGYLAQRTMACRSDRDATQAALVFTGLQVVLRSLLWLPLGLGLLLLFPPDPGLANEALRAEREASFVRGMSALPAGLLGLMLTAMLAALASTIDTHLNWGASYWTHDLYERLLCRGWLGHVPSPRSLVWVARGASALILLLALAILPRLSSIQTAWQTSLLLGAGMGVMLVLRWIWWRVTAWSELATLLASALLAPLLLALVPSDQEALRLLMMAGGATLAGVLVALFGPPEPRDKLEAFHRQVRPPGFWGPVARAEGADDGPARLARGLTATGLAAWTCFAVLTALGSWLVGSPAPQWMPWRWLWIGGLLLTGLAAVPIWWRAAFSPRPVPPHPPG
jgi:Na+/proline symporter